MGYATTMMKKTGRAMRLDTQIIEVRPLLLRKEQVRLRLRETCARNHKSKKPKSLDTTDVVRDVVKRPVHQQQGCLLQSRSSTVQGSRRRTVGWLQLRVLCLGFAQDGDVGVGVFPETLSSLRQTDLTVLRRCGFQNGLLAFMRRRQQFVIPTVIVQAPEQRV